MGRRAGHLIAPARLSCLHSVIDSQSHRPRLTNRADRLAMLRYSAKVVAFFACAVSVFGQRQLLVDGGYEQCTNAYTSTPPGWTKTPSDCGWRTVQPPCVP
jgi:hypothetical protein